MKKALLLTMVLVCCASMAFAQAGPPGSIGLFSDDAGTTCNLDDPGFALCKVFVLHLNAPFVTASEWAITEPSCLGADFAGDNSPFDVYIGSTPFFVPGIPGADPPANEDSGGKSVGYGECLESPILVATLTYICDGSTTPCCLQTVVPHGITGVLSAVDCDSNLLSAMGGSGIWNADASCPCMLPVATHESTWGRIKAMFE